MATTKIKRPKKLTLGNLRAWLKIKDPKEKYEYNDIRDCLMAQFGRAMGYNVLAAYYNYLNVRNATDYKSLYFPVELDVVANYPPSPDDDYNRTFGGALTYLETNYGKRR